MQDECVIVYPCQVSVFQLKKCGNESAGLCCSQCGRFICPDHNMMGDVPMKDCPGKTTHIRGVCPDCFNTLQKVGI